MKIISFQDVASLKISPLRCYDWAEEIIKNKKETLLPPKISMKPSEGVFCNVMPSIVKHTQYGGSVGGVKVVTRYPDHIPSLESRILLMDMDSGEFLALMDGTWITAMRTGAVAAHTIMLLARKDFKTIGMVGLGNTARSALWILAEKMPGRDFNVRLLKYKGQETLFIERFQQYGNLHFQVVETAEDMVRGSDVVISGATYLPGDLCADDCFGEGILVVPIHTRGFTNCDLFFDKIYADDRGHVCHFKNFDRFQKFAEVCDVVNGNAAGREDDRERILAYNIGISAHDIGFAANIFHMFMADPAVFSALPEADMQEPTDKFWV